MAQIEPSDPKNPVVLPQLPPKNPREILIKLLGNRYGLIAISILAALQASGYVDLAQVFVLIGLADRADQVWGWGIAIWGG
jgi:hypothetical protein